MHNHTELNNPLWGARINRGYRIIDYPAWANKIQRDKWTEPGLILWDNEAHQITSLTASQALDVLEHLRTDDRWREKGLTLGEPATILFIDEPEREPEPTLTNQMSLTVAQVQELFKLLQRDEMTLQKLKEQEEKERSERLNEVYRIILGDEILTKLALLYQQEPEKTIELAQELIAKRMGQ